MAGAGHRLVAGFAGNRSALTCAYPQRLQPAIAKSDGRLGLTCFACEPDFSP
jgi:hypothetical protein